MPRRVYEPTWGLRVSLIAAGATILWGLVTPMGLYAASPTHVLHSASHFEVRIPSRKDPISAPSESGSYIALECRDSVVNFTINWRERVGQPKERRRHLFYHANGDKHLMLPAITAAGDSTGYIDASPKAKSLVYTILKTVRGDDIPIGVFPAGRDLVTGEWIDAFFSSNWFKEAAIEVGKVCQWDPMAPVPIRHEVDNVTPGSPYRP